ncbi:MAG: hypothetical protein J5960_06295, partial [Desulfovibrio sp.]|nr:hypothetical protein [Desulfovibrio sp.]
MISVEKIVKTRGAHSDTQYSPKSKAGRFKLNEIIFSVLSMFHNKISWMWRNFRGTKISSISAAGRISGCGRPPACGHPAGMPARFAVPERNPKWIYEAGLTRHGKIARIPRRQYMD